MNNVSVSTAEFIEGVILELYSGKDQNEGVNKFRATCARACEHPGELILVVLRDFTKKQGCIETLCLGTLDNKTVPIFLSPSRRFGFMVTGEKHAFCVIPSSNGICICESNITVLYPYPFSIWECLDVSITKGNYKHKTEAKTGNDKVLVQFVCGPKFEIKIGRDEVLNWFIERNKFIRNRNYINIGEKMFARLSLTW